MKDETIIPVIRNTEHGQLYIYLYAECHRVYLVNGKKETFLYTRSNRSLTSSRQ